MNDSLILLAISRQLKQVTDAWFTVLVSPVEERKSPLNTTAWDTLIIERKEVRSRMYWLTGILGFVLAMAPWVFNYADNPAAMWTSVLIGVATMVVSVIEGARLDREAWEYWIAAVLGVVAIIAPFAFGFRELVVAMSTTVIAGVLLVVLAGGKLTMGNIGKA